MKDPKYQVEVDRATESDWSEFMDRFEDANIYQTWSYGAIRWRSRNLSHVVMKRDGSVIGMAQLRIIRPRGLKAGIAYLRWGPLCQLRGEMLDRDALETLADALHEEYAKKRGLYLEILPNAFSGSSRAEAMQGAFSKFDCTFHLNNEKYRTLVLDLEPSLEELRKNLDKKWRNQLNAAERNSLTITAGVSSVEYSRFCELYAQMWERKKFTTTVSVEEFGRIQESLPEHQRMQVSICEHEGKAVAGLVCSALGASAIYLLGATNEDGMKAKAAYVLHWKMIERLKERGFRAYDLGGIDPEANPGVYHFKRGFSGMDVTQMGSLAVCDNFLSLAMVRVGQVVRGGLRRVQLGYSHG